MTAGGSRSHSGNDLRVAVFTHDTFGLGHVRRCLHIVRALSTRRPDASILLITGSPAMHALRGLPPNVDVLKIPTIVQTGSRSNAPPHLRIPTQDVSALRRQIICSAVDSFRPHVFLVDNFPLGSRKELVPALERLRELDVPAVLGLRDIVDRPEVVRETWEKDGIYRVLAQLYDRILVYGVPEVFAVTEAYGLPASVTEKLHYCGYVTSESSPRRDPDEVRRELDLEPPIVLATVGGGGDGLPLLASFLEAARDMTELSALAITGPLMAAKDREQLRRLAEICPRSRVREFVEDLPSYLAAADLVLAMGGYNTVAELVALGRRALVMPRNWRYGEHARGTSAGVEWEQSLRVEAMERLGLLQTISPDALTPASLSRSIRAALEAPQQAAAPALQAGGVQRVVEHILQVAGAGAPHGR
jgi:predicted glycosyltransferase